MPWKEGAEMLDTAKKRHRFRLIIPAYPAFNIYSNIAKETTALGPVCIASAVREMAGWDAEVIDENNLRRFGPKAEEGADHAFLERQRPVDVAGFYGGLSSTIPRLYRLAKFYKERGAVTVAGGHHFVDENVEEALESGIDYLVFGEGEETIRELLEVLRKGGDVSAVDGIAYLEDGRVRYTAARAPIRDFDRLPLPDFSLVRYAKIKIYPVERIRGCGMDCEFCSVKGRPRCAAPERLLESISYLVETQGAKHFFIVDDLFGQQRSETLEFCRLLRDYQQRIRKRFSLTVQIRLDKARDSELLSAMAAAGVRTVCIGFESPIEEELAVMKKKVRPADMLALTRLFRRAGFLIHGMFIFGYPSRQEVSFEMPVKERIKRFKQFISRAKLDTIQVLLPIPLPGTELRARLRKQNRIYPITDVGWEYYDGNFPLFEPDPPLKAEELLGASHKIMGNIYQFKYMFMVGLNIVYFPALVFFLHDIRCGWQLWKRPWRNNLVRFGGWLTMRKWASQFGRGTFPEKLRQARTRLCA